MRKTTLPLLILTFAVAAGCGRPEKDRGPEETVPLEMQTTTSGQPASVVVKLVGLCTIANATVAGETAKQTAILANFSGHEASFIVQEHHLESTDGFTQLKKPNGDPSEYWAYPLYGMQIELDQDKVAWDGGTEVVFSTAGDSNNATYPTLTGAGKNASSIHWIPSMTRILGTSASVRKRFVQAEPSKNDVRVRMPMRGGTLESKLDHPYFLWQFRTAGHVYKQVQVVADQIHYSFPLKTGEKKFKVYGRKFAASGGQPDAPAAMFTVKTHGADEEIEIFLANLPPNGFFAEDKRARGYKDPHFHQHYKLLDGNPPHYEPVIIGSMESSPGPLGSTVYCGSERLP